MNHPDYYSWTTGRAWLLVSASMSGWAETEPHPYDPVRNKFDRSLQEYLSTRSLHPVSILEYSSPNG